MVYLTVSHHGHPIADARFSYDPMPPRGKASRGLGIFLIGNLCRRLGGGFEYHSDMRMTRVRLWMPAKITLNNYIEARHEHL